MGLATSSRRLSAYEAMAPSVNGSFKIARRRRAVGSFVSPKSRQLDESYNAILDTFRERITLLEISQRKHAPRDPALAPRSECVTRDPTWQVFLNQLSWLCDYDKGGDSTNSIAVQGTPEGPKYWLAANFDEKEKGFEHLKKVLGMLAELSTLPRDKQRPICDRLLKESIDFSERKFNNYEKSLKTAIHFAEKSINQEEADSLGMLATCTTTWVSSRSCSHADVYATEKRLLKDVQTLLELNTGLERSVFAFKYATTPTLRKVHRSHRDNAPKDAGSAWYELCHYTARLGSWVRAVRVLVYFVREHPQVLENFQVGFIAAPKICKPSLQTRKPKLLDVLWRILPEDKARAARLFRRLESFPAFNFEAAFSRKWRQKKFTARSHAELMLLDHFWRNNLAFFQSVEFVGSSKRSCYCCNLFFELHNSNIATRLTHSNTWSKWCLPPGLARADKRRLAEGQVTILERMNQIIARDILHHIEEGVLRHVRLKDSTTGMWTAPTLGFSMK